CEGGGIRLEECIGLISECLITENYSSCDAGGIYLLNSNVTISGCEIANNFGNSETGGVYIEEGYPIIIGCTITGNRGKWNTGGGIYIKDAYPVIGGSAENRNIIKDNVTDSWGNDIYAYYSYPNSTLINASYNHLRVYPATPAIIGDCEHFDLSNCTGDYSPISEDIYVSPLGSSTNSGLSPDEPLNTITLATIRSMPSENNPITIYLDPGVYTDANGGEEIFPINIMPYSTLQGSGVDETLIKINTNYNAIRTDWSNAAISDIHITAEDSCRIGLYMVGDNQIIQNCLIDNFYGDFWVYGIRVGNGLNQLISNTVVRNCSTPLYYYGNTGEISNCTFEYNDRAAYFSNGSQGTISSCIFRHNHTYYYGGGVRLSTNSTDDRPWVKNCLFHDNIALLGGAVFCENDDDNLGPIFENCVIYNNQAEQSGGAFYADHDTQVNIINSIVFGNTQLEGYQLAWYDETFNYNIEYSDISDTLWPGTGNLNANPGFSDPANYEFQLQTNSVCIDAGSPNPYYNDIEDPANQGFAQYPSRGTIRNDIGVFGGPLAGEPFLRTSPVFKENILEEYLTLRTFPNPFNSHMEIEFALPSAGRVRLSVYNLLGREIAILADEFYPSGLNRYNWNAQQFSSGFYFARIETQNKSITQKVLLLK
nr:T9SS type A sorting domain-containing protein [Candidatus Neomarinimicrobiota bacterium]